MRADHQNGRWGDAAMIAPSDPRRDEAARPTVLGALRVATGPAHEALSTGLAPEVICSDGPRYAAFLTALYGFHRAAERALAGADAVMPAPARRRSELIARDLAFLGSAGRPAVMPWTVPLTEPGAAWGVAYVVEGSALGGLLLAKFAHRHLGLGPGRGADFFADGAASGGRWRQVKAELGAPADAPWATAAVAAAVETFQSLERWMASQHRTPD